MVTTIEKPVERKVRTAAEMLTQVPVSIPTTGLVYNIAIHCPVHTLRPVLFAGAKGPELLRRSRPPAALGVLWSTG